jgi:TfoX/Sxy family transcriptional regulator of competence genes
MPYNPEIAQRVQKALEGQDGLTERKMFGGIAFMLRGNMCCGVTNDDLMVRVGAEALEDALVQPYARPMDFTGRPMKGFVFVDAAALGDRDLKRWVQRGVTFAGSLPAK